MSNINDHIEELDEFYNEVDDCDYDAINDAFEERVWDDLDDALHNKVFAQTFQEKLYKILVENYAEQVHFCGVKEMVMSLLKDME